MVHADHAQPSTAATRLGNFFAGPHFQTVANHRTGRARGRPGGRGTTPWRDDPEVLRRVELVGSLYNHPTTMIHQAVNEMLRREEPPKPSVGLDTIKEDRRRALELWRERAGAARGVEMRLAQLEEVWEEMWHRIRRTPANHGQSAAALAAVALRCVEDSSKLDGSWGAGGLDVSVTIDTSSFGKSPMEQLHAGDITEEEYLTALRVLHAHTNAGSVQAQAQGEVIDGKAQAVEGPREDALMPAAAPQPGRGPSLQRGGTGGRSAPSLPRRKPMPDEINEFPVIDMDGADFDDA